LFKAIKKHIEENVKVMIVVRVRRKLMKSVRKPAVMQMPTATPSAM
jgi:hypothetical protein